MKEEFLTTQSTSRILKYSPSFGNYTYDYKDSSSINNQTQALSYKAKKIIEKYNSKNRNHNLLNVDNNLSLSFSSKENNQEYKKFFYKEGDNYDVLVNKNKNLKRLFEEANCSLILSLKKQEKMEMKYENEKKEILEKLSNIQTKYELYARSHQKLNDFERKINEMNDSYNQLVELYIKSNYEINNIRNKILKIFDNINNFVNTYYNNESVNIFSFEYLLHIKNELNDKFNLKEEINSNNNYMNNIEKKMINHKIQTYYTRKNYNNNYTKRNNKINNKFYKTSDNSLNDRNNNKYLMNFTNFKKENFKDDEI
jgi:hypothetical protein